METCYTSKFVLLSKNVDFTGRWRPDEMFIEMQEVASHHSEILGAGFEALRSKNLAWVATRMKLQMVRYPHMGDEVVMRTWPAPNRRWLYPRHYAFETPDGRPLGAVSSLWVLIDLDKRAMVPPAVSGVFVPSGELPAPLELPGAAQMPDAQPVCFERKPAYTDLDVNGHVGNTRYIAWLCDALGADAQRQAALSELTVNFAHEIRPGQRADMALYRQGEVFGLTASVGETIHFSASGTLACGIG